MATNPSDKKMSVEKKNEKNVYANLGKRKWAKIIIVILILSMICVPVITLFIYLFSMN